MVRSAAEDQEPDEVGDCGPRALLRCLPGNRFASGLISSREKIAVCIRVSDGATGLPGASSSRHGPAVCRRTRASMIAPRGPVDLHALRNTRLIILALLATSC
jgi:hypothetical protein